MALCYIAGRTTSASTWRCWSSFGRADRAAVKQAQPGPRGVGAGRPGTLLTVYAGNDDMLFSAMEVVAGRALGRFHPDGRQRRPSPRPVPRADVDDARSRDVGLADLYAGLFVAPNPIRIKEPPLELALG